MCILGGMTDLRGAILGSAILTLLNEPLRNYPLYQPVMYAVVMLLVIVLLPRGIVPSLIHRLETRRAEKTGRIRTAQGHGLMLEVRSITKSFGGVQALGGVSIDIARGDIFGLIGPNGAGKTTTFNVVSGLARPDSGEVLFEEQRIEGLPPYRRAKLAIARTFQHVQLMAEATVLENVMAGAHLSGRCGIVSSILRPRRQRPRGAGDQGGGPNKRLRSAG